MSVGHTPSGVDNSNRHQSLAHGPLNGACGVWGLGCCGFCTALASGAYRVLVACAWPAGRSDHDHAPVARQAACCAPPRCDSCTHVQAAAGSSQQPTPRRDSVRQSKQSSKEMQSDTHMAKLQGDERWSASRDQPSPNLPHERKNQRTRNSNPQRLRGCWCAAGSRPGQAAPQTCQEQPRWPAWTRACRAEAGARPPPTPPALAGTRTLKVHSYQSCISARIILLHAYELTTLRALHALLAVQAHHGKDTYRSLAVSLSALTPLALAGRRAVSMGTQAPDMHAGFRCICGLSHPVNAVFARLQAMGACSPCCVHAMQRQAGIACTGAEGRAQHTGLGHADRDLKGHASADNMDNLHQASNQSSTQFQRRTGCVQGVPDSRLAMNLCPELGVPNCANISEPRNPPICSRSSTWAACPSWLCW